MKLSIIIPVYNEINTIKTILKKVIDVPLELEKEIIIVDDASSDGTTEVLENVAQDISSAILKVFFHPKNLGKGAAIRTGLSHSTGEVILIQDADLEYEPSDYPNLLSPIIKEGVSVVYGSRFKGKIKRFFLTQALANRLLTLVCNLLYLAELSDMETCYKVFKKEVIKGMEIKANRFEFEPEITAKILKRGFKIKEVPISYYGRKFKEGKKIGWKDGILALWTLIKYRFTE